MFVIDQTHIHLKYTSSIPYSAIPSTLKYSPRVKITNAMAFVTFDQTVIALSIRKESVFEESVVLYKEDVLGVSVQETTTHSTAIIYTLESGILEYEINTNEIHLPEESGNIYAEPVEDVVRFLFYIL